MEDKLTTSTGSATTPSPISALVLGHVTVKEELRDLDESPLMQQQQQSLDLQQQQQQQQQQMVLLNSNTIHVVPRRRPYVRSTNRSQAETCVCEVCQGELSRFEALLQHKLLHFNSSHVCYVCDSYFVSVENLLLHMTGVHREIMGSYPKGDAFVCPVCVQRFSSSKSLLVHQSLHSPSNKQEDFSCTICSVDLHSCRGLLAHLGSSRHKEMKIKIQSIFICIDCRSVFANRDSYAFHMMMRAQNEVCDSSHNNDNNNLMLSSKNSSSANNNNNSNNNNNNSGNNNCYNRLADRKSSATPGDDIKPSPPQPVFPQPNFMATSEGLQHSPFLKTSESSSDQLSNPYQRQQHKQQEHLQQQQQQQQQQQLRQLKSPSNPSSDSHSSFLSADTSKMSSFPNNASYGPSIQQQFQQRQLFLDELMSWNAVVNARGLSALASRGNLMANQQLLAAFSDTNNLSLVAGKLGKKRLESFVSPTRFDGKSGSDVRNLEGAAMNDHNNRHNISLQQRQLLSHQQNLINLWMQRFDCELSSLSGSKDHKQQEEFRKRQSEVDLHAFHSSDYPAEHKNNNKPPGLNLKEEDEEEEEDCDANADQSSDTNTNNNEDEEDDGNVFSSDEESQCPSLEAKTQKSSQSVKGHPVKVKSSENKSSQANLALGKSKHIKVTIKKKQKYLQAAKKKLDSSERKHSDNNSHAKRKRKLSNSYSEDGFEVDKEVEKVDKSSKKMLPLDSKKVKARKSLTKIKASESLTKALKWKEKSKKRLWRSASATSFTTPGCSGVVPVKRPRSLEVMEGINKKLSLGERSIQGNLRESSNGNMMLHIGDNFHFVNEQNLFAKKISKQNIINANLLAGSENKIFGINERCTESDNCAKIPQMRSDIFLSEHKLYADGDLGKACQQRNKFLLQRRHLSDLGVDDVDIDSLLNISTTGGQDVFGTHDSFVQRRGRVNEQGLGDIRQNTIPHLTQASFLPSSRNFSASPQEDHHPLNLSLPCLPSRIKRQDKSEVEFDSQKQFLQFAVPSAGRISINTMSAEELGKHYELVSKHFLQRKGTGTPVDRTGRILNIIPGDHDRDGDDGATKVTRVESPGDDDIVEFVKVNRSRLSMCRHCGLIFSDKLVFYLHMGLHNLNDPWQCNLCGKICSNLQEFSSHVIHY